MIYTTIDRVVIYDWHIYRYVMICTDTYEYTVIYGYLYSGI
jgi:hypothetical protein